MAGDPDDWVVRWCGRIATCRVCRWVVRIATVGLLTKPLAGLVLGHPIAWWAAFLGAAIGVMALPLVWALLLIAWAPISKPKR